MSGVPIRPVGSRDEEARERKRASKCYFMELSMAFFSGGVGDVKGGGGRELLGLDVAVTALLDKECI